MSGPPARGVLFDATGTLIEPTAPVGEVYRRVALDHGVDLPAWRLDDAFRRVMRRAPPRGTRGESAAARRQAEIAWWHDVIRQTFQATDSTARFDDFPAFADALFDAYRGAEAWRARPGVPACLAGLAAASLPMAVVSNFDHRLGEILEALDLKEFFDAIITPSEHGFTKPDGRPFQAAAEALALPLGALVYVGDDPPERLAEIAALGLAAVLDVRAHPDADSWPALLRSAVT